MDRYMPVAEGGRRPLGESRPPAEVLNEERFTDAENALGAADTREGTGAYRPLDGTGRNVGVVGREVGVGIELSVEEVPALVLRSVDTDRLDGARDDRPRFRAEIAVRAIPPPVVEEGCGLKGTRDGLGERRRERASLIFSLSFTGDGESSMISTHPL
jgi:hypothetical protein